MDIRSITVIDKETHREGGRAVAPPARKVAACAVLGNPLAGEGPEADLAPLVELSVEAGTLLTGRALDALPGLRPRAYSKGVIVGLGGALEHGAAMIHVRIGLAMRRGVGRGLALIPGTKKVAGPGAAIDLLFGGIDDAWDYDAMDAMEVSVPGAPAPDEVLLIVAFATGRPNARIKGASPDQVAALVQSLRA
jgi:Amino acid synthesis